MAAPTSTNEVTARKLSSSISALWTKIKSTFQPVADRVTSIRAASSATDTNYPTEKAVRTELDGKLPKTTNASEIISSTYPQCFYSTSYYYAGYVLFYDVTSAFDGTFTSITDDSAHVAFSGFVQSAKYNGFGVPQFFKVEGKVNGKYPTNYNASTSKTYGPVVLKRTYEEDGVTKQRYYFAIKVSANYGHGMMFFGVFHTRGQSGTALSWDSGFLGNLVLATDTEYSVHWSWTAGYNVAAESSKLSTARKLAVSLSNTSTDASFDGSADVTNIKTTGTLGVGNGGTGMTSVTSGSYVVGAGTSALVEKTPKEVGSNVLSSLDDKSNASSYADFVDNDFVVGSDHVDASTISASTFVRRTALNLWNYIKSKLTGSDVNVGGNAATATKAAQDADGNDINTTYKKLAESSKFTEPQWIDKKTSSSYCDIRIGNSFKLLSVGVSSSGNILIKELADQRTNSPAQDKAIIYTSGGGTAYNFNGNAATATALADDSAYVHKSGSETISGTKKFTAAEVNSDSSSGTYSGFFVKRTAAGDSNHVYRISLEVTNGGSRGLYDYGGNDYDGDETWIIRKTKDGDIKVGKSTDKVYISDKRFDFSGTIGNDANAFYLG